MEGERFYEAEYPSVGQVVMAKVTCAGENLYMLRLLEYDKPALMVNSVFLQGRKATRRYQHRLDVEMCRVVQRIDTEKGFIDLSSKGLTTEEVTACKEKYHKAKMVMNILHHTALSMKLTEQEELDLLNNTVWHIDRKFNQQGKAHHIFQQAISDPSVLDICDIDEHHKEMLLQVIRLKLSPPVVWLRSVIHVTCFSDEGIDAVKTALLAGKSVTTTTEEYTFKIRVVSSPEYELSLKTSDVETGREIIRSAQCLIEDSIVQAKGEFKVIKQTCVRDHGYWETTYRG